MSENDYDQLIANYLKGKKAFILEPSNTFSVVLNRALEEFGMDPSQIVSSGSYAEAEEAISQGVEIVISEYQIKNKFGLDLATLQKKVFKSFIDRIFIIGTSNATESAVAEAAEEDVDGYILKPFSSGQFEETFRRIAISKLSPSDYWQHLQEGQEYFEVGEIEEAMRAFEEAEKFSDKPSLACFYQGLAHDQQKEVELALVDYQRGLNVNPIHYKCLQGQFEILFRLQKRNKAYEVAKVIKKHYPITPQRLANFFLLAVYTHNFEDLNNYYETFEEYENRPEDLCRMIGAGLLAAGKYAKKSGDAEIGFDYLKKSQKALSRDSDHLNKIIKYCLENGDANEAEFFLSKIPSALKGSGFHLRLEFLVFVKSMPVSEVVQKGKQVVESGDIDFEFYDEFIRATLNGGQKVFAEDIVGKAIKAFPDKRAYFNGLIDGD